REDMQWMRDRLFNVPFGLVETLKDEKMVNDLKAILCTKDLRCLVLLLRSEQDLRTLQESIGSFGMPGNPAMLFAFTHHEALKNQGLLKEPDSGWSFYDPEQESAALQIWGSGEGTVNIRGRYLCVEKVTSSCASLADDLSRATQEAAKTASRCITSRQQISEPLRRPPGRRDEKPRLVRVPSGSTPAAPAAELPTALPAALALAVQKASNPNDRRPWIEKEKGGVKLFVGRLPREVNKASLEECFNEFGEVLEVFIIASQ
ncbi:unnamed protein product, partial [Effrenium voratum]